MYLQHLDYPPYYGLPDTGEDWAAKIQQFVSNWQDNSATHIQLTTSGSTGTPTVIKHAKINMLNSAKATIQALALQPNSTALLCLPADKIGGMMMIVRSIALPMYLCCVRPSLNPLQHLSTEVKINFAAFTPSQMRSMLGDEGNIAKLNMMDNIILGGEAIDVTLEKQLLHLRCHVYETYGMTETISHIALRKIGEPAFKALSGISLSVDERSCLVVTAPYLFTGTLLTNDIVELNGTQFVWKGRYDNVINSGGVKVHAEEVETELQHFLPYNMFVIAMPNEQLGQSVALVIEGNEVDQVKVFAAISRLPKYHKPKAVYSTEQFTYTPTQKIKRKESLLSASLLFEL